ncbi:hypothetical protein BGZ76_006864 [Entomortierella beljakovae]|nr:hypothetical protein BGZ76_006864 [Entomortierella beljakovae]
MKGYAGQSQATWNRNTRTRILILLVVVIVFSASLLMSNIDIADISDISWVPSTAIGNTITKTHNDNDNNINHNNNNNNNNNNNDNINHDESQHHHQEHIDTDISNNSTTSSLGPLEPAVSLLDANTKYLTYFPFAGLTNQFIGLEIAAFIAKKLNRTLIIPPIMSNTHDHDNTHQRWSRYFDLIRFTHLTGVPILEWDLVRPLTPAQRKVGRDQALLATSKGGQNRETEEWRQLTENITCQIIDGYGSPEIPMSPSANYFIWHFLFRPILVEPPEPKAGMENLGRPKITGPRQRLGDVYVIDDLLARYEDTQEQLLVLSHTFKLKDTKQGGNRLWDEIGANFHFVPQLMEYATIRINEELLRDKGIEILPNDDPEEDINNSITNQDDKVIMPVIPTNKNENATESGEASNPATSNITAPANRIPHIAVHLRRGDIGVKCTELDMEKCFIPLKRYESSVAHARAIAAESGLHSRLPVVVTTDTTSLEDIQRINELGWHRIDHATYGTKGLWGSFGEALVDSAILAHADQLVGSEISTMSRIAAQRQKSWYSRRVIFPSWKSGVDKVTKRAQSAIDGKEK